MEKNLLQKEEEYHKLNAELELKTKELLKEVEGVMKIQDRLTNAVCSSSSSSYDVDSTDNLSKGHTASETRRRPSGSSRLGSRASQHQAVRGSSAESVRTELPHLTTPVEVTSNVHLPVHGGIGDEVLPEASYGMGTDGLIRFLKAKVKGLQKEMEAMQTDFKKRTDVWRKQQADMKVLEQERNKWQQQAGALKESLKKQETQASSNTEKVTQQESENMSLKKELENLKKELRTALQTSKANEVRLNRSLEELEKLRTVLQNHERDDKELRDLTRRRGDEMAVVVKRLEKQKTELLHGFRKQMQLIDNLKKQKAHLQAACMMQFSEEEFLKLLDWCPNRSQT